MAKVDKILKEQILEDVISNYNDEWIESEWCADIIPIIFYNRIRNLRMTRQGEKFFKTEIQYKIHCRRLDVLTEKIRLMCLEEGIPFPDFYQPPDS